MADEAITADRHQLADKSVGLYFGPVAYPGRLLDLYKRPDETVRPDGTAIEVDRFHDFYVRSENDVFYPGWEEGGFIHMHGVFMYGVLSIRVAFKYGLRSSMGWVQMWVADL